MKNVVVSKMLRYRRNRQKINFYGSDDKRRLVATIDSKIYAALKVGFLFKFGEQTVKFKSSSNLSPKTLNSVGQI
ncbi:hypothetical protein [uncultured Campylobacter sp.]|uniref:hypothetical protein n=1 Tax=uncultured Campylobacter sp. TaxID=218934 RepID=UPI0026206A24|nr:hypothetical protein [uncultured Campylobacter sp.]